MRGALRPEFNKAASRRRIHPLVPLFTPMKKPKITDWKEYFQTRYASSREEVLARAKERYRQDPDKYKEKSSAYQKQNPEKQRIWKRNQLERRGSEMLNRIKRQRDRNRDEISDCYVSMLLRIPVAMLREHLPNLLESKRQEILLKRKLNPKQN